MDGVSSVHPPPVVDYVRRPSRFKHPLDLLPVVFPGNRPLASGRRRHLITPASIAEQKPGAKHGGADVAVCVRFFFPLPLNIQQLLRYFRSVWYGGAAAKPNRRGFFCRGDNVCGISGRNNASVVFFTVFPPVHPASVPQFQ